MRSGQVPGKKDSASMAVKGERDPAARAHIHPTSSRKPVVAEATPVRGRGHGQAAPTVEGGSWVASWWVEELLKDEGWPPYHLDTFLKELFQFKVKSVIIIKKKD